MTDYKELIKIDHGNVFNTGHWYTFYCGWPDCSRQIDHEAFVGDNLRYKHYKCPACGKINYLKKERKV